VSDDAIELEADEVCRLCSKSSSVKLLPKLTGGTGFFTDLELFFTGGVVTWVDTVWLDRDAAVVASRTFLVAALGLVGEGAAVGTVPTFVEDADWAGTTFFLLDLFLFPPHATYVPQKHVDCTIPFL
jgi:hypothetical protein